ncbi:MAG: YbjN domain-containing protein [Oscillospiraceae bacterium]|nr:YbjN domain-containing protein [Oscillospiraceae bacterium]
MNTERQLTALLDDSGVVWRREMGEIRFRFTSGAMTWETACRCLDNQVLVYGRYPFEIPADRRTQALEACGGINSRVVRGGIYLTPEGRVVFRTWADMGDAYTARDALARALEYNIAVVTHFWGRFSP